MFDKRRLCFVAALLAVCLMGLCACGATPVTNVNPLNFSRKDNQITSEFLSFTLPAGCDTVKFGNRYNFVVDVMNGYLVYACTGPASETTDSAGVRLCPNGRPFAELTEDDYKTALVGDRNTVSEFAFERTVLGSRDAVRITAKYHYMAGLTGAEIYCTLMQYDIDIGGGESLTFWVQCFGDEGVSLTPEMIACFDSLEVA